LPRRDQDRFLAHRHAPRSCARWSWSRPGPEGYREIGRFRQHKRTRFATFAHPVVANGRLFLRDDYVLFCYDIAEKKDRQ
jgi:hypothetical protein